MSFFNPANKNRSDKHRAVFAAYEIGYTAVDFLAAVLFVVGSAMFFDSSLENPAIWCFLVGSIFFAMKPTIRIVREFHLLALGDYDDLDRVSGG